MLQTFLCLVETAMFMKSNGFRAFAVSASELWNSLPDTIRSCDNLITLKSKFEAYFFKKKDFYS